jgi:hypothetical protein
MSVHMRYQSSVHENAHEHITGFWYIYVERIFQQAIAQLIGDPRYLRFNVLIREDAKV